MEKILDSDTIQALDNSDLNHPDRDKSSQGVTGFFPAIVNMIAEDGNNFFRYLKELGLSRESNLVVLSSRRHYYYDETEMQSVKTLINLKKLNEIKYLDEFLYTLSHILPADTKFLGCFLDCNSSFHIGVSLLHPLKLLRQKINILDLGIARTLNKKTVSEILESYGFEVADMTEMEGLTYFCAQNVSKPASLRA